MIHMNNHPSRLIPPCAACKFLKMKCTRECVFAPHFPADQPQKFAFVHKFYGASNVAKILGDVSPDQREDVVSSLVYEAEARLRNPVYGCVGFISELQQRLEQIQTDLLLAKKELSGHLGSQTVAPIPMQSSQPLMVDAHQSSTRQSCVAAVGPKADQSNEMFQDNEGMKAFKNSTKLAGFVDIYGYDPMKTTMVTFAPRSSSSEEINDKIQPQNSEGHISSDLNMHSPAASTAILDPIITSNGGAAVAPTTNIAASPRCR